MSKSNFLFTFILFNDLAIVVGKKYFAAQVLTLIDFDFIENSVQSISK